MLLTIWEDFLIADDHIDSARIGVLALIQGHGNLSPAAPTLLLLNALPRLKAKFKGSKNAR